MSKNEEQKGRIMPREDFKLTKFKLNKDGVTITHHVNGVTSADITAIVEAEPHPDLISKMDQLKLFMASRLGLLSGWDFARDNLKKNPNALTRAIQGHKDIVKMMNVNGLTFVGSGETYGVMITGSIKVPIKGSTGLSVPKISFDGGNELGYEDDVEQICEEITDEIYNYLILRKKGQTNIEDQSEGFDNDGGLVADTIDMFKEEPKMDGDGFDEKGERDFVPNPEQLPGSNEEE
jgi:hypothetical protein